jgi:RNA polymerase sigma factor (sigma-70 family)
MGGTSGITTRCGTNVILFPGTWAQFILADFAAWRCILYKPALTMTSDCELLRQYIEQRDEGAFTEVVRHHADLVYSAAWRVTGNAQLAQDVTQAVFSKPAQQAKALTGPQPLVGWLHTTTRHMAINAMRGEARRRVREQEALAMQNESSTPAVSWEQLRPILDEAAGQLRDGERQVVLLRFFEGLSHQEVGTALGLTENAAQKRVDRALEKLRVIFVKRGITVSSALLASAMRANSVQAAPVGLVRNVATTALAGAGSAAADSIFLLSLLYMSTKTKAALLVVVVLAIVTTLAIKLQSAGESPVPTRASPSPAGKTQAPPAASLPNAAPAQVVATRGAPAPARSSSEFAAPPNADLKTAIPALISYLEANDYVDIIPFLMTPEEVQQGLQSGHSMEEIADKFRTELNNRGGADFLVQALNGIRDQPANLDPTGTQAVYEWNDPVAGPRNIRFINKDGLWYGPQ